MIKAREIDKLLILATMALVATGIVMVYSTSYIVAMKRFGDGSFFIKKHLFFVLLGVGLFMITMRLPYHWYRWLVYPGLLLTLVMLVLVYVPGIGVSAGGARRWLRLPFFTFQPSEVAKLSLILYLAYSLSQKVDKIKTFSIGILPHIIISGILILLIVKEPDFGGAALLGAITFIMMYVAGVRIIHLMALLLLTLPFLYLMVSKVGYRMERIMAYLNPWESPEGAGFQAIQSFLAFGAGGMWGVGLGDGLQKLFYLPQAHTDFILSVIGEELGLLGVSAVLVFYLLFLLCGIRITLRARDLFGSYLALGITLVVTLQAVVNMAVVMGLLPPKGLTLPFVSYGGTSLLVNMVGVGILLNIFIKGHER